METKKLTGDLIIEVTRNCNLTCEHCLRGKAENKCIDVRYIENTIVQFEYISHVTFTGGEPSLNPQAITNFIRLCEKHKIGVGSFYIATNAKHASDAFMVAVLNLYSYCDDNEEMTKIEISNDYFHQNDPEAVKKLQVFKFTDFKYNDDFKHETRGKSNMLNQGFYADNYGDGRTNEKEDLNGIDYDSFVDFGNVCEIRIYLNCDGKIVLGCDWSFENQKDNILCDSSESIFDNLLREIKCLNI